MTHTPSSPVPMHRDVIVVGVGNIGAALIDNLARMSPLIRRITIFDRDSYGRDNLLTQAILPRDVGRPKAAVQKSRIERISEPLRGCVAAVVDDVRNVPLSCLRCHVILSCVDSKAVRRYLVQAAWRLGVPVIDAGVNAREGLLARVTVYVPGADSACIECGWSEAHYENLERVIPCLGNEPASEPTGAPLSLGMLAASLQAIECAKLLTGDPHLAAGREILMDAACHRHYVSALKRNPACRFDHATWDIQTLPQDPARTTVADCLHLEDDARGWKGAASLRLEGRPFVRRIRCSNCGCTREVFRLLGRPGPRDRRCRECGGGMEPIGFYMSDYIDASGGPGLLRTKLSGLGFLPGDVFTIEGPRGEQAHWELCNRA